MSRPQGRFVRVNPQSPEAAGVCDRCGFQFPLRELTFQTAWAGTHLYRTGALVCTTVGCLDIPNEQLRTIILPPDPPPIMNSRVPNYAYEENTSRICQFAGAPDSIDVDATFLGYIVAQEMVVVEVLSGSLVIGSQVIGIDNTFIEAQIAGDPGEEGAYIVSRYQTTAPNVLICGTVMIPTAIPPYGAGPQIIRATQDGEQARILQYLTSS